MKIVPLSTGEQVTLKEKWTHKMEKEFDVHLFSDSDRVTAKGLYAAYDAAFGMSIEKIEKGGQPLVYSVEWLDGLLEVDYKLLQEALLDVRRGGKKNTGDS